MEDGTYSMKGMGKWKSEGNGFEANKTKVLK